MKYFEVNEPYYALIKAKSQKDAIAKYEEVVADDYDGELENEITEISRDTALITYARGMTEDNKTLPVEEILTEFNSYEADVLLIDRLLL